jgi:hypothetical protein
MRRLAVGWAALVGAWIAGLAVAGVIPAVYSYFTWRELGRPREHPV